MRTKTAIQTKGKKRSRKGFSLVSMLVAMVLLGVGVGALARANGQTVILQNVAQNRTNAIAIGRSYLELVRTRDPWTIESESAVSVDAEGNESGSGQYRRTMTVSSNRQNLIRIEVQIEYPRGAQPVTLNTMLFRGNGLAGANN